MAYSIVILDDHPLIVESLTTIVSLMDNVETVKAFSTAKTFYEDEKTFLNDLYIIDISLGAEDGRDVMKQIRKKHTEAKIIALSSHDHPRIIQSAFRSGADSYLLKTSSASEIKTCIETLLKSEDYLPSNIQKILQNHLKGQKYETLQKLVNKIEEVSGIKREGNDISFISRVIRDYNYYTGEG